MAIDWRHQDYIEEFLKKTYAPLNNQKEFVERLTILLNLNSPSTLENLEKKVRKVYALNEHLAFKKVKEKLIELGISIKKPEDIRYKIKDCLAEFHKLKKDSAKRDKIKDHLSELIKLNDYYNNLLLHPYKLHLNIKPIFNSLAEYPHKVIVYAGKNSRGDYLYERSKECDRMMHDLKNSLRGYVIEFCQDKKEILGPKRRKF